MFSDVENIIPMRNHKYSDLEVTSHEIRIFVDVGYSRYEKIRVGGLDMRDSRCGDFPYVISSQSMSVYLRCGSDAGKSRCRCDAYDACVQICMHALWDVCSANYPAMW